MKEVAVRLDRKFSHLVQRFVVGEAGIGELFGRGDFFQDSSHCAYCCWHLAVWVNSVLLSELTVWCIYNMFNWDWKMLTIWALSGLRLAFHVLEATWVIFSSFPPWLSWCTKCFLRQLAALRQAFLDGRSVKSNSGWDPLQDSSLLFTWRWRWGCWSWWWWQSQTVEGNIGLLMAGRKITPLPWEDHHPSVAR